jgi:integrase
MPAKRKKEKITAMYFNWLLGTRNGVYFADGRSNVSDLGRHSLGTRDRQEALRLLVRLDLAKAVASGRAARSLLEAPECDLLSLEEGRKLYLAHVGRAAVLGGATPKTVARYRAVLAKFLPFAQAAGVQHWQSVSKKLVASYGARLDDEGYDYATEYLELTTLKQLLKWLHAEKHLPTACRFELRLEKPRGTTTYCYKPAEVEAMVQHCFEDPELGWLGEVIVALATTGLRISELAALRWTDIDLDKNLLRLTDTRYHASKAERQAARTTKTHRGRVLPIHPELQQLLSARDKHSDGLVFHGPRGGVLKPDTVRNVLVREVLTPLAERFPKEPESSGLVDGRLHSFRHFFCSLSANSGVPEQVLMTWLGHRDSSMVKHYYHLDRSESQRQMARIDFIGRRSKERREPA